MSDVVITDSDDTGGSPTEEQQVAAVAETAGSAAEAGAAAEDAKEAEVAAEESSETATQAAVAAVQEAQEARAAAGDASFAAAEIHATIQSLSDRIDQLAGAIEGINQVPQLTPVDPAPTDTAPNNERPQKTPFLQRKWGSKS